ncbi:MAG: hypothetical protein ABJG88_11170 [Litorimonas sp.]
MKFSALCIIGLGLSACASTSTPTNIKQIYDRSAQYHLPDRNPVIVIPGILGSSLVDETTGKSVWGIFRGDFANPNTKEGARLITLPIDSKNAHHIDPVKPNGVLETLKLSLAGFPIKIQAYAGILTTLGAGGYRDQSLGLNSIDYGTDHFTCFQFDYDWRQDISYNAAAFKTFIDERRAFVQSKYKEDFGIEAAEVKFDIVAHSMGALLTRYYLRYGDQALPEDGSESVITWAGAQDIERAVLVAPPNAGSLEAFEQLLEGFNKGRPVLPRYAPAILGSFPSIYQLLPRSRHKNLVWDGDINKPVQDLYDPKLWQKYGWGLSSQDKETTRILTQILPEVTDEDERSKIAMQFQAKALARAQQFHAAIDSPATAPAGLDFFLVAGDAEQTAEVISIDSQTGDTRILRKAPGDTTVLRSSALLDERASGNWKPTVQTPIDWEAVLFVPSEHRKITSNPVFEDNVLYWLLEEPRQGKISQNDHSP